MKNAFPFRFALSIVLLLSPVSAWCVRNGVGEASAQEWIQHPSFGFLENKGQLAFDDGRLDRNTLFTLSTPQLDVFITKQGIKYIFLKTEKESEKERQRERKREGKFSLAEELKRKVEWCRMDMTLQGADIRAENVSAEQPSEGHYNYFFSHCPDGVYDVRMYRKITIKEIYPGIDWVVYISDGSLSGSHAGFKYDFIVHPGADPSAIRMVYKGAGNVKQSPDGSIVIETKLGEIREESPYTYQQGKLIGSAFVMEEKNEVRFSIGTYDRSLGLVIDPKLSWGTLYGGAKNDGPMAICADASGSVYITGYSSPNVPTVNPGGGAYYQTVVGLWGSASISKFNPNGSLFWSTFYGGNTSGSMMYAQGTSLVTNAAGDLLVTGNTCDTVLPLQNPGGGAYFQSVFAGPKNNFGTATEGFILKFTSLGVRQWATYYGGTGMDSPHKIHTDATSNIYVTGSSLSTTTFPVQNPGGGAYFQSVCSGGSNEGDIFILKFNSTGVRQWATLYGGTADESGRGINVDASGNIYVDGTTLSANLPLMNMGGAYNQNAFANFRSAFILRFNSAGVQQWGTFFGNGNYCNGLALDLNNNLYILGNAYQTAAVPITNLAGAYNQAAVVTGPDAWLAKFNPAGAVTWATFLGGNGAEFVDSQLGSSDGYHHISTDCKNNVYITGMTYSTNFPTVNPGCNAHFDNTFGGGNAQWYDLFMTKFNSLGAMLWSTYYGQNQYEFPRASCVDPNGNLFVTGEYCAQGNAGAAQFPLLNPGGGAYFQNNNVDGFDDGFVLKLSPVPATLTTSTVAANCGSNGSASVTATCASPPFTYNWSNGGTTQTITGLNAGTYTVIVGSSGKCIASDTAFVTVTNSGGSVTANTSSGAILCNGGLGSASVTVTSGTSPYTYSWNNGQTTANVTGLSAGTYTINITDATGCGSTKTVSLTQPTAVTATATATAAGCGASNGTANASATGGTGAYTYSWNNGQATATATGLSAGTYTITVTDNNGCTKTATVAVTSNSGGTANITANTNVSCNGGANGTATSSMTGGTSPYTYAWNNGQSTATATGLSNGTYTVTIADANGCTSSKTVSITQPTAVTAAASATAATCNASNATASVTASGGTGALTYSWSNGQTNASATGLSAGTYTVTVTDNNGCTKTATATVTSTGGGTANIASTTNVLCNGGLNGSATASITGGTSPYTYSWSNGQATGTATGLSAGVYTVTVTDANGCTSITTVNITQPVQLSAGISGWSNPNCTGGNNGTASATANGGTGTITYSWSTGGTGNSISGLGAGTYTVTSTDANNCVQTASVVVSQPTLLVLGISGQTNVLCNGGFTGTSTASSSGGSGSSQYLWSNGQTTATATGLSAGTYTVTVTDVNGCTQTAAVTITEPSAINPQTSSINANCGASNGSASVLASGGTGILTYSWSNGQTTTIATGLSAGTYTVTVTDNNGCTKTATASVTNTGAGTASISSVTNVSCNGGNNGMASSTISGGTSPYTFSWSNGQTVQNVIGLSAGSYTITITDANGCIATQTIAITEPPLLVLGASAVAASCQGSDGSASASASGGKAAYVYSWSNGGTTAAISNLSAGTYSCVVTDNNGCTKTTAVVVGNAGGPTATATATATTIQSGASTNLNGTGGGSYNWIPSTGLSCSNCQNPVASPTINTLYCVTVTDSNGCTDQACVMIYVETPCPANLDLSVPNAFSPNGDGHNDVITLHGWKECVTNFVFIIYDRWGEKVFESDDPAKVWDGIFKGKPMDPAVFAYYISATNNNNEPFIRKGNITLLR